MNKFFLNKPRGVVALISILIISAITILLVLGMSEISISSSYQAANNSAGKSSYYAAESCLEEALIRLKNDPTFSSAIIAIDNDLTCSLSVSGSSVTIISDYLDYSETFQADISLTQVGETSNIQLLNWHEI